jgi:hypothetical protein
MRNNKLLLGALFLLAVFTSYTAFSQSGATQKNKGSTNGHVAFWTTDDNQIIELSTNLIVPDEPAHFGTLFVWPGIQPRKANHPIGNGVLQSVLTWGPSCAPGIQPPAYSTWWISAQYVNNTRKEPDDCLGGPIMDVRPGDNLSIQIKFSGSNWTQTIHNPRNGAIAGFKFDIQNQVQKFAYFDIELGRDGGPPVSDAIFTQTMMEFETPDNLNCTVKEIGDEDSTTPPVVLNGGKQCYIEKIVLKSPVK